MSLTRSEQMARIRSNNTAPERQLRSALWTAGFRFRLNVRTLFGVPDLVFLGARVAVYVDGCFWHGCPEHYLRPRSRSGYWSDKLRMNVSRDQRQTVGLETAGWRVCRVWEHEIAESLAAAARKVMSAVRGRRCRDSLDWRAFRVEPIGGGGLERWHLCTIRADGKSRELVKRRAAKMWSRSRQ